MWTLSALSIKGGFANNLLYIFNPPILNMVDKKRKPAKCILIMFAFEMNRIFSSFCWLNTIPSYSALAPSLSALEFWFLALRRYFFYYKSHIRMTLLIESCTRFMFIRIRFQLNLICDECLCNPMFSVFHVRVNNTFYSLCNVWLELNWYEVHSVLAIHGVYNNFVRGIKNFKSPPESF